jgi:hypothetical protein
MFKGKITDYPNYRHSPKEGFVMVEVASHYGISHSSRIVYVQHDHLTDFINKENHNGRTAQTI